MRVAILHYHLRPGGVTRVIEMAHEALLSLGIEALVISGEPQPGSGRLPARCVAVVPELRYGVPATGGEALVAGVERACRALWGKSAEVLHTHNHALGKNAAFPAAVAGWAASGRPLVAQLHDFAENARPSNYAMLRSAFGARLPLYPSGGRTRLVALTSSAAQPLGHLAKVLPNPVTVPDIPCPVEPGDLGCEQFWVYPTRALRRKNLGEFLLLAACAPSGTKAVVTSAPTSPEDVRIYREWVDFARELDLPVVFDAAAVRGRGVYDFLPNARAAFSTSIEEGFGMAFLEPWAVGCEVRGRDLPEVTGDFRAQGLACPHFYSALPIPGGPVERRAHEISVEEAVRASRAAYGLPHDPGLARAAAAAAWGDGRVDFAALGEEDQKRVIRWASRSRFHFEAPEAPRDALSENRRIVAEKYSPAAYGKALTGLYGEVLSAATGQPEIIDPARVLWAYTGERAFRFNLFLAEEAGNRR